jgi:GNAT superfamily N-acetyltransferase
MTITIKELTTRTELSTMHALIQQRNPSLEKFEFENLLDDMIPMGYRCIGAYKGDELIGVSGFWVMSQFYCRKSMRIDNFIVDKENRGKGIGKLMLNWIQAEGKKLGCTQTVLDSLTGNVQSHRFYFREGFSIIGFHFAKKM